MGKAGWKPALRRRGLVNGAELPAKRLSGLISRGRTGDVTACLPAMSSERKIGTLLRGSLRKSIEASWAVVAVMLPVSLGVTLLQHLGWLERMADLLAPLMRLLSLPAEASFALLAAALVNLYAGIAVMATLPLGARDINVIAVMMLVCHNLIVESAVQSKTGVRGLRIAFFRIAAALVIGFCLSRLLPAGMELAGAGVAAAAPAGGTLGEALAAWGRQNAALVLKIVLIVTAINIASDLMRFFGLFGPLTTLLRPVTFLLGLPKQVSLMWVAGAFFGLAYGAGVLIGEARSGNMDRDSLLRLNISLGICHSLVEDTLLFMAVGGSLFWLLAPRMAAAALAVWLQVAAARILARLRSRRRA
jgi:spore maturation protein SpmB